MGVESASRDCHVDGSIFFQLAAGAPTAPLPSPLLATIAPCSTEDATLKSEQDTTLSLGVLERAR